MKEKINNKNCKICAIICEYNPMHTGHIHLINKAKEITKCDYILGLMSGNFVQRSSPAVLDKYTRAEIATKNGLDLVLNFPTAFCINNAEVFAFSAIKILNQFNIDYLAFGVETLNEEAFYSLANFLIQEPKEFKIKLKQNLTSGEKFSSCLNKTILENLHYFDISLYKDIENILTKPNNILALEYIKAIIKTKSKIKPILVKRVDNFNNDDIIENFASSTFIRKNLKDNFNKIERFLPENSIEKLKNFYINQPVLEDLILYNLKTINIGKLKNIYGVSEGLENKLKNEATQTNNFEDFYSKIVSKRYKESKINSIILNSLFNIDKKLIKKVYTIKSNIIVKVLAVNNKKTDIFSIFNNKNLIIRKQDMQKIKLNKFNKKIIEIENKANCLYNLIANTNLIEQDYFNKLR